MLKGYSLPLSPGGRSSLVPSPPWHYVGDLMVIEYWADPEAVRAVLPPGLEPHPTDPGRAAAIFADWQSCTDGGSELLDPARSQYMEFFIVVNATARRQGGHDLPVHLGRPRLRAHARLVPGLPEEARVGLDDAPLRAPERRRARAAAGRDVRRHAAPPTTGAWPRARSRSRTSRDSGPTHNAPQLVNVRHFPRLNAGLHDKPAVHELAGAVSRDRSTSEIWEGSASLELFRAPNEEHTALAPVRMGKGFRFTFAYTVDDQSNEGDLRTAD